jgi:hypothetical protein
MNLSDVETGCYIDCTHRSNFVFMCLVIELAHDYGFEMDWEQYQQDIADYNTDSIFEDFAEILDALDWTFEDALEYLNTNTREGLYWEVIDQSLYLTEDADASQ